MRRLFFVTLAGCTLLNRVSAEVEEEAESRVPAPAIEGVISISGGGAFLDGNRATFEERFQRPKDGFGGIEKLRYLRETKLSSLSLDGRLMAGEEDYRLNGRWTRDEKVYVDFGYTQFRTFYDGGGKFFPPTSLSFRLYDEKMHVDRAKLWLELGFTPEDLPRLRLRYERLTREGVKPSTELGDTNLTGGLGARSIVPSFLQLDETRDVVTLDADFQEEVYQWAAGLRYERGETKNARQNRRRPTEAAERAVTSKEGTQTDIFSSHAFVERKFGEKLLTSVGGLASTLDLNLSGSRLYGADYDPVFDAAFARRQVGDAGFFGLSGAARLKQYVTNLNAVYYANQHWTIQPSLRYEHLHQDNLATYVATNVPNTLATSLQSLAAQTQKQENKLTEKIEIRYTGRPSWTYSLRGEWFQTAGDLAELQLDRATSLAVLDRATEYTRLSQKYTIAANWYARPGLSFASEYYYKLRLNDYDANRDSTRAGTADRYPAFLTDQDFATHDVNVRMSWRPAPLLSFVTRYDYQRSRVVTSGTAVAEVQSARATSHIVSQSVTWSPLARLYVLGSANLTYDQLATPAAALVQNADNNHLTASLGAGYAVSKRSDLFLDLTHHQASNFSDSSLISLPYGSDQWTQTAALTWVFRATQQLVYTVKYTRALNRDDAAGGRNDYRAHVLYANVQYHF